MSKRSIDSNETEPKRLRLDNNNNNISRNLNDNDDDDIEIINDSVKPKPTRNGSDASNNDIVILDQEPTTSAKANPEMHGEIRELSFIFPNIPIDVIKTACDLFKTSPDALNLACDHLLTKAPILSVEKPSTSKQAELNAATNNPTIKKTLKDKFLDDFKELFEMFKNCDPAYLFKQLKEIRGKPDRVECLLNKLLEEEYPKLDGYSKKLRERKKLNNYLKKPLDIEEFLKKFPDPVDYFYKSNLSQEMSTSYKTNAKIVLMNEFDIIDESSIEGVLRENNFHFAPAFKQLKSAVRNKEEQLKNMAIENVSYILRICGGVLDIKFYPKVRFSSDRKKYFLTHSPRQKTFLTGVMDERFLKEYQFVLNEAKIYDHLFTMKELRFYKIIEARKNNALIECKCCFDNELLAEDMLHCDNGHVFCSLCIKRYAQTQIGECKYEFKCFEENCDRQFGVHMLRQVLDSNAFSNLVQNMQKEEIKKAGIEGLESCPGCGYSAIVDNPEEKVFKCSRAECLKETCRFCKEASHLPKSCQESKRDALVENQEVEMRKFIEDKVTESMLRVCHECHKRFYKTEGCNMMHCNCGAQMCYLCRMPIEDYNHFTNIGCKLFSDSDEVHHAEMDKAYREAIETYLKEHPECHGVNLKNDPKKVIDELSDLIKKKKKEQNPAVQINNFQPRLVVPLPHPRVDLNIRPVMEAAAANPQAMEVDDEHEAYLKEIEDDLDNFISHIIEIDEVDNAQ